MRDRGAVLSALARPRNLFAYDDCVAIAQLAAAYIFGIAKNHGFADGNKRTALVVGDVFLMLNGYEDEVYRLLTKTGRNSFAFMWENYNATTFWEILPCNDNYAEGAYFRSHSHPMQAGFDEGASSP